MSNSLGESKNIFYFDVCGQINTEKALKLAIQRANELSIKKLVVASETGLSALKVVNMLRDSGINLIVVTSAAGTKNRKHYNRRLANWHLRQRNLESAGKEWRQNCASNRSIVQHWCCFGT